MFNSQSALGWGWDSIVERKIGEKKMNHPREGDKD
jgi:hypothetical protein